MNGAILRPQRSRAAGAVLLGVILVLAGPGLAMADETAPDGLESRAFEILHRPLAEALDLVAPLLSEGGTVSIQPRRRTLLVRDTPAVLDRVAEAVERYDLPPRDVEVTLGLVVGSDRRAREAGRHVPSREITREMRGVVETLGDFTKWTEYDAIGRRSTTCVEGRQVTVGLSDDYRVSFRLETVEDRNGKEVVTLDQVVVERLDEDAEGRPRIVRTPATRIVLRAGQQVMVGTAKSPDAERAVFLTVQAKPR